MFLSRAEFSEYVKNFNFKELFNVMGWDNVNKSEAVMVNEEIYNLEALVEKRGFMIFLCQSAESKFTPDSKTRKKIERQISKLYFENLIIFIDASRTAQTWQLTVKEPNKPAVTREITYNIHQYPEILYQRLKGLLFTLDEEEKIGLVDVKDRVTESFNTNAETVTKRFYDRFKKEHSAFQSFIEGIEEKIDQDWYASLMLNRLMFIYFIQKKGFLDNNRNYLRNKLTEIQQRKGKNKFYSFYRDFLLVLFHKGLGSPDRDDVLLKEIGQVPYLNGGLFDIHHIEKTYSNLNIHDKAFENIFDFFDQYNWHLDTSITSTGRDINPDVIGYIFEKYINDRAAMGAYYTKEDITHYIAKNCIIPYLFQEAKKVCANAFHEDSTLWKLLDENPDRYIYEAVQHGVKEGLSNNFKELDLNEKLSAGIPENVAVGIDTGKTELLERRKYWNTKAPCEFALPTEIWREVIDRRKRYWEVRDKIVNGDIRDINDFITYNLDIQQFAQDVVEEYEGSDLVNAFYNAIRNISVLDPTCGSGAFLFAALNILEPLYESCLERMENFVSEEDERGGKRFSNFRKILDEVMQHPNRKYYIYKSIILNNLYGVDIMNEAVEIAKLRLFLKLVAEVDRIDEIEPLPDIDFNIRSGNTLVGFATYKELQEAISGAVEGKFDFTGEAEKFREEAEKVGMAFSRFKDVQLVEDQGTKAFREAKDDLQSRLNELNEKLNIYLAKEYGVEPEKKKDEYESWKESHKPFHWFAEFYEIIQVNEGFDVIIGNPPYVTYPNKKVNYHIHDYETIDSSNLFSYCSERSSQILNSLGNFGFIVLMSAITTQRMYYLRKLLIDQYSENWFANLAGDWHPGKLFEGVRSQFTIILSDRNPYNQKCNYTTNYIRWFNEERENLTSKLNYIKNEFLDELDKCLPKLGEKIEKKIWKKITAKKNNLANYKRKSGPSLYYRNAGIAYYLIILEYPQHFKVNGKNSRSSTLLEFSTESEVCSKVLCTILNSNLFAWYYFCFSDCYHLTISDFSNFYIDLEAFDENAVEKLVNILSALMNSFKKESIIKKTNYKTRGLVEYQEFYPRKSKHIIDQIDTVLSEQYQFSQLELDFIINYDIKYRMGDELDNLQ